MAVAAATQSPISFLLTPDKVGAHQMKWASEDITFTETFPVIIVPGIVFEGRQSSNCMNLKADIYLDSIVTGLYVPKFSFPNTYADKKELLAGFNLWA